MRGDVMGLRSYVLSKYISGTSDEDMELDINQLSEYDSYAIDAPKNLVACDIFRAIEDFIHPQYTEDFIRELLDTDGKYKLLTCSDDGSFDSVILTVDNEKGQYYYDFNAEFISRQIYTVYELDDGDAVYLVSEHIINPEKGCSLIERCYKPYFRDIFQAMTYRNSRMKIYSRKKGTPNSGYRIFVVSASEMDDSEWYNANIEASGKIINYHLNPEDYRYIADMDKVNAAIIADAYDELDIEEQAQVNFDIIDTLRDFIPDENLLFIDDDVDNAAPDELEEIADFAITIALANADSEETFNSIHEALGPSEYRIGALTDDIYNENPDSGYIVVSKEGELGWYSSCYAINEWSGSEDSPYHGVFQPNENDVLLSFREFHPELFPDTLPKKADVSAYEEKYMQACSVVRREHHEMSFESNMDGDILVFGTWYYNGLLSNDHMDDIYFFKDYGSHVFTDDECRQLLSGEEIIIEHFITKTESEITIKGKLKDCSGMFDEEARVEFVRTDIDPKRRRAMTYEMGFDFEEPGLPSID
jgi:hypothetical protein